jgi:hypothetical protein
VVFKKSDHLKLIRFVICSCLSASCVQTYIPPPTTAIYNYLVIDGFLNAGSDSTYIRLSRTAALSDSSQIKPEAGATVMIEGNNSTSFRLYEQNPGNYSCGPFNPVNGAKYRLHILTALGIQYVSDYVTPMYTTPIDSVTWANTLGGVTIYVNTHGKNNSSPFYRWVCFETWEFHPPFESFANDSLLPRLNYKSLYTCWHSDTSSNILLGTSANLNQNIIYQNPIIFLPDSSWKLSVEYSVFVQQQTIDQNTFSYYQLLQTNTENLGTLFDVQPSSQTGNFHCLTNPTEIVIGYLYSSSTTGQRIFINNNQVPGWFKEFNSCGEFHAGPGDLDLVRKGVLIALIIDTTHPPAWLLTEPICADCRLSGTNVAPPYWPN